MHRLSIFIAAALAGLTLATNALAGDTWPQFRGPTADGHSDAMHLPVTWSETENVTWKVPVHDRGWSSPLIWQNQIWLTSATVDGHQMYAICLDRQTGATIHDVKVFDTENLDHISVLNSYASPTGAIEDGRVYVHYGTYGTACLDTATGKKLWERRDLKCDHHEGAGSSMMLFGNLLIFHVDGRDVQYVIALDKGTGENVWKRDRSVDFSAVHMNERKAFCTPIVIKNGDELQLVSPGAKGIISYNPATGEELWKVRYNGWSMAPRPLYGHGMIFFIDDYERPNLLAVRPDGHGDVTDSHVTWRMSKGISNRPSLILLGDLLYMVNSEGVAVCVDAKLGDPPVWKHRLGGNFSASPIEAAGRIYFFDEGSTTTVIEAGREFKQLAVNKLAEEPLFASPAVAGEALFVRTEGHLYRIEQKN
ncbi:MAG TPA: PQQ-binding-like beta-propeller repeat protein [Pirellulales bacterium]|nr:PQQ-binding-like beta-propeller repeat protein [Pirellulales bacterium]